MIRLTIISILSLISLSSCLRYVTDSSRGTELQAGELMAGELMAGEINPSTAIITFEVDLNCPSAPNPLSTVNVTGSFCNWCDTGYPLLDNDRDGIYTGSFELPIGLYEYKYMLDMFQHQEDLLSYHRLGEESCAPITDQVSYAHRLINLDSNITVRNIYGHCETCNDRPSTDTDFTEITFDDPNISYLVMGFENASGGVINENILENNNHVGRIIKDLNATSTSGVVLATRPDQTVAQIPISVTFPWMSIRAYSPHINTPVRLKIESTQDPSRTVEVEQYMTDETQWETLFFDFSQPVNGTMTLDPDITYDKLTLFFNFGVSGEEAGEMSYFFDDIIFWGERPLAQTECTANHCPYTSIEWIHIDQGIYRMGVDQGVTNEMPAHQVSVPNLEVMKSELTTGQYRSCVDANVCEPLIQSEMRCEWSPTPNGLENHPVNCLSRTDLVVFAEWLREQHSYFSRARLITEAEWEYAAKSGGETDQYPWGMTLIECNRAHYQGCEGISTLPTVPVCSKTGNSAQGLCDMLGNVAEWVADDWSGSYVNTPRDGSAFTQLSSAQGVTRGGHFNSPYHQNDTMLGDLSLTMHTETDPMNRQPNIGGRLARFGLNEPPIEWISLPIGVWNSMRVLPFEMMKTELSVGQYRRCMEADICETLSANRQGGCANVVDQQFNGYRENHPIRCLKLSDMDHFTQWLETQFPGYNYRIPSVNEWLFASSNATGNQRYPWVSETISCNEANVNLSPADMNCPLDTQMLCSPLAGNTTQGLCNMIGNVSEWAGTGAGIGQNALKSMGMNYQQVPQDISSYQVQDLISNPFVYHETLGGRLIRIQTNDR